LHDLHFSSLPFIPRGLTLPIQRLRLKPLSRFTFDQTFGPDATQSEVFEECGIVDLIEV